LRGIYYKRAWYFSIMILL